MKTNVIPCFNNLSSMFRVFGDPVESTDIRVQEAELSKPLLSRDGVEIKIRLFFWKPTFAPFGTVSKRFECYYKGVLVDYSMDRTLIVKTFRWLTKKGQIHA